MISVIAALRRGWSAVTRTRARRAGSAAAVAVLVVTAVVATSGGGGERASGPASTTATLPTGDPVPSSTTASTEPPATARTTDVDLLPLFGRALFAYSGGNPGVLEAVRSAGTFEDRGGEWAPAYARSPGRRAPHDLYVRPWEVLARPGGASAPPALAPFRPEAAPSPVGDTIDGIHLGFTGVAAAPASWRWLPEERRWLRQQRGRVHVDGTGYAVGPRNVVVVFTEYVESAADTRSPESVTVGGGEAWVLTDGRLVQGRWERADVGSPLVLLDGAGRQVTLAAGRSWIELVSPGTATVTR